jgi:uncharacterized protein
MSHSFGSLMFTPAVKALQERYGSRRQYAKGEQCGECREQLTAQELEFIAERDSFYIATVSETGWPYVQHRGGAKGFLQPIDERTLGFADYRGNKQYVSTGNLVTDSRVALILVDYPSQARLKILGRAKVLEREAAAEWIPRLYDPAYKAVVERVFIIDVQAFDWNCQQHITPRFTPQEIQEALAPYERRLQELERENAQLRGMNPAPAR